MTTFPGSTPLGSSYDGGRLTVSAILRQPTFVQAYLLNIADQLFVGEKLFRHVQSCPGGVVVYHTSTPLFADDGSADLDEFEEIPATLGNLGTPQSAVSRRKGLAVQVSEQMRTRNDVNAVNIQLEQVRNTLVRDYDGRFMATMDAAVVSGHTSAAAAQWGGASTDTVRTDISVAAKSITGEKRGFRPDALLIDQTTAWELLGNPNIWQIYRGDVAGQNPQLTGSISNVGAPTLGSAGRMLGLNVWVTMDGNITAGDAYVMQTRVFGGISDERPLRAVPWYEYKPKEQWRSDVTRASASFVDQPLALAKITGVR